MSPLPEADCKGTIGTTRVSSTPMSPSQRGFRGGEITRMKVLHPLPMHAVAEAFRRCRSDNYSIVKWFDHLYRMPGGALRPYVYGLFHKKHN